MQKIKIKLTTASKDLEVEDELKKKDPSIIEGRAILHATTRDTDNTERS